MLTEKKLNIDSLLEELMMLEAQYAEALKNDAILSEKKDLRIKIRQVQQQIQELKNELL